MEHAREYIRATKSWSKEDRTKSWVHSLTSVFLFLLTFFGALYSFPLAVRIFCSIITGLLLVRIFTIYHDYLHETILQKSTVAKIIFSFIGFYTLNPPSIWKRSHDHHHQHNSKLFSSSIGSFPIVTTKKFLSLSKADQIKYLFIRHPLTIAFGYIFAFIWGMTILSLVRSPSKHWDSAIGLIVHFGIGLTILLTFGWLSFLLAFLIPALISSAMGSYLFYAQHNFPTATFFDEKGWTYIGAALLSSSYMKMNPVMHWFTGNIGYHHIHHTNIRIPFYYLPDVYKNIPEFQDAKTTSLNPKDIIACFKMKVWDPDLNRMLTMKEIKAVRA